MGTKQSSSKEEEVRAIKRDIITFQMRNYMKKHTKSIAVLFKALLRGEKKLD